MAKSKLSEETRLKVIGMLKVTDTPLKQIADQTGASYHQVMKIRDELEEAEDTQAIESLVDVDEVLVHRIAKELTEEFEEVTEGEHLPKVDEGAVTEKVNALVEGIDGYQQLSTKLQASAINLANKIDAMASVAAGPLELQVLVDSLATLQSSFFNKNVVNVNVLNAGDAQQGGQQFKGLKLRS